MSGGTGFGITQQGFVSPQITDLQTDLNNGFISAFGAQTNTKARSFFGQLSGVIAERLWLPWIAMQDVYDSQTPSSAFGASLDNVGDLRGIPRLDATSSTIGNVRLFGTAGTVIPSGTQFNVINTPSSVFASTSAVTLVNGQDCVQTLSASSLPASGSAEVAIWGEATAPQPYNVSAAALQAAIRLLPFCSACVVTGSAWNFTITFAGEGTGGLMVQPQFTIVNSSLQDSIPSEVIVTPLITVVGIDQGNVNVQATGTGPIVSDAGSLTVIKTPVGGLDAVLNTQDALVGTNIETDTAYRLRMNQELQVAGAGTVEAIRARLLKVNGVTSALVYENSSYVVDLNGRPPKSFEAVVAGGTSLDIGNTLWAAKPAGIETFGNHSQSIVDSQGQTHIMKFSRPTAVPIYLIVNITVNDQYPSNGDTVVKEALANYINSLGQGKEVIVSPQLIAQLAPIAGIEDAGILAGTAPGPTLPDNIPIAAYQVATAQTTNITVNHV